MKKIITFSAALVLGVCAFGATRNVRTANADIESDLSALISGYNSGGYTKKTQIFLTETAMAEAAKYFHAGATQLKRTTYYKADNSALLMGDFNGGFATINGGYKNDGVGNAIRFHYTGNGKSTSDFFTANETDYVAKGQTVGGYYQTLGTLAGAIKAADWTLDGDGWYRHNVGEMTYEGGEYSDQLLKQFQYFAAPMLLQGAAANNYLTFKSIWVREASNFLSIRLYLSSGDAGKVESDMHTENEALLAECRVYKGLDLDPGEKYYLRGVFSGEDNWNSGYETKKFAYYPHVTDAEQYKLTINLAAGDECKVGAAAWSSGNWGRSAIDNNVTKAWFGNGDNLVAKLDGSYDFYLKTLSGSLYVAMPATTGKIVVDCSAITEGNEAMYVWAWEEGEGGQFLTIATNGIVTLSGQDYMKVVRLDGSKDNNPHWDNKWDESDADIAIQDGGVYVATSKSSSKIYGNWVV